MIHKEASRTTQRPALLRAAHQLLDDVPKIFVDPLAVGLIPEASAEAIFADGALMHSRPYQLLRSVFVVRARYAEDCLAEAVRDGVGQYVILGAGLDTFAYRQPAYARDLEIFEVDHPATQAWKRTRLTAQGITPPRNLRYLAVDFERDRLERRLAESGFSMQRPAFFSWLGVVQFLSAPAIEATLRFIAGLPRGSAITLSFAVPRDLLDGEHLELAEYSIESCASRGEPWVSLCRPGDLRTLARQAGFSDSEHLDPAVVAERYFSSRSDGLCAPRHEQLLTARV
jgi:methyltransferase (TIGR00027 family)